jgi:hypothetical protein
MWGGWLSESWVGGGCNRIFNMMILIDGRAQIS